MYRLQQDLLRKWLRETHRKPLVIRGARQVGKSTLVRNFCSLNNLDCLEVNLEKSPSLVASFEQGNLKRILDDIQVLTHKRIDFQKSLLFLDEIQAAPPAISQLRYLYEDYPTLPVISAGSLLEFSLEDTSIQMPVGRVEYLHMGPMTFREFLIAFKEDFLIEHLDKDPIANPPSAVVHEKLVERFKEFLFIGGMPEAVRVASEDRNLPGVRSVHRSIIETYRDDFPKYSRRIELRRLQKIFDYVPLNSGQKIKYANISRDDRSRDLKRALDLLIRAKVVLPVYHTGASGTPLKKFVDERVVKLYFLDVGLSNFSDEVSWESIRRLDHELKTAGSMAEQFVAQHLFYRHRGVEVPQLYYWVRDKKSSQAELDFLVSHEGQVIPIEVKAGKSGRMRSLSVFLDEHPAVTRSVRFDLNPPSLQTLNGARKAKCRLFSLPIYWVDELQRLLGLF